MTLTLLFQIGSGQKSILMYQLTVKDCDGYENNFKPLTTILGGKCQLIQHIKLYVQSLKYHVLTYIYLMSVLQNKDLHIIGCDITQLLEKLDQEETFKR